LLHAKLHTNAQQALTAMTVNRVLLYCANSSASHSTTRAHYS